MFSAPWCGPCRAIRPLVDQMANDNIGIQFVYVNTDEFEDKEKVFIGKINGVPTFHSYRDGKLQGTVVGGDGAKLRELVTILIKN